MGKGPLQNFTFIGISELQKVSSARLTKLTHRPLVVSDKNQPKFVILSRVDFEGLAQPTSHYDFLVGRQHPWRTELWVKGRNLRAFQVVSFLQTNHLSPEQTALEIKVPVKAVYECLHYFENNKELIQMEALEEKRRLMEAGFDVENLPR